MKRHHVGRTTAIFIPEGDVPWSKEVVERRDVGTSCAGHPPLPGVLVKELDLGHYVCVVPVSEHDQRQSQCIHISLQLVNLVWKEFFLSINYQECTCVCVCV